MFKSIFTNAAGILFSRVLGFARDVMMASQLGASIYSDIFFIAFKLPNLFRRIFAEGAFTQAFLPSFTRSKHKAVFSVTVFALFLGVIVLMCLLVTFFPHISAQAIALGYDEVQIELAAPYVAINFWYLPLIFAVTFLGTLLQYRGHFATTAYATGLLNVVMILALWLARDLDDATMVEYLSYGVVLGGVAQLLVHLFVLYRLKLHPLLLGGVRYFRRKAPRIREERQRFYQQFFPAVWGNSSAQFSAFLDTWLASFLAAGAVSYLYYANRVFQLPLALFAIATSIALFPKVSRHLKHGDEAKARDMLRRAFWFLAFLLTASTIGGIILAPEITALLFERGAFTCNDTAQTALVLQMYLAGLLPFGLSKLFSLWLYAQQRQSEAATIATWMLGTNILFSLALITPMGAAGLALATSLSGIIGFIATVRAFGYRYFLEIITHRFSLYWLLGTVLFTALLLLLKDVLH